MNAYTLVNLLEGFTIQDFEFTSTTGASGLKQVTIRLRATKQTDVPAAAPGEMVQVPVGSI